MLDEETRSDESGRAVFTRVYQIADYCGNIAEVTQTITLNCGEINLTKKTFKDGVEILDDTWSFAIYEGPNGFSGNPIYTQSVTNGSGWFNGEFLSIDETYTVCEIDVPAGWGTTWQIDTNGDGEPDKYVIPYNPDKDSDTTEDFGNRCFDFGADTDYPLLATGCDEVIKPLVFEVVNSYFVL